MTPGEEIAALKAKVQELEAQARDAAANAELLRAVLEAVPVIVMKVSPDLKILFINRLAPGVTASAALGSDLREWIPPNHRSILEEAVKRAFETQCSQHFELDGNKAHNERRNYLSKIVPCQDSEETYFVLAVFDVTEFRTQQQALEESAITREMALDVTKLGLWSWDSESNKVTWNQHMHAICGVDTPLTPTEYLSLVHPEDRKFMTENIRHGTQVGQFGNPEHRLLRLDGSIRWVQTFGKSLCNEEGKVYKVIGGTLDITERRQAEVRIRHSQKQEAVGQLTAGVAHNFNNMLAVMLPSLQILMRYAPPERQGMALSALDAGQKAADLIQKLMRFAGEPVMIPKRLVRADEIMHRALEICRRTFAPKVILEEHFEDPDLFVNASGSDLEQVIVNLLINARDAVENVTDPRITISIKQSEDFVQFSVIDNGPGVPPQFQERIFDPFFTTKEPGRGTGLGLATVYAIARDHDGSIRYEPSPGHGATFIMSLPLQREEGSPSKITDSPKMLSSLH